MELNIFCCKPDLKTFLKSKAGAERNEKTREFCVHTRFTNSWKLDETERKRTTFNQRLSFSVVF